MGWWSRRPGRERSKPAPGPGSGELAADVGVPELADPRYVRLHVLGRDDGFGPHEAFVGDVQPAAGEGHRATIVSGTEPSGLHGLVLGWHVPAILDAAAPERVYLLEPPCGPDLPLVEPELQRLRDARDLRTSTLLTRYPPPSAAQLAQTMAPTAVATHPAWDAVCFRLGLLSTPEARAVIDAIRADGNAWERAEATLYSWGPAVSDRLRHRLGPYLMHLGDVAPYGREIDRQPFWTIGLAAVMRELSPDEVDPAVFERVTRPFVDVCGPLPELLA